MSATDHPQPRSAPFLSFFLTFLTVGGILLFLILVSGGFFLYVLYAAGGLFLVGMWHYLLWGYSLDRQTKTERDEERAREEQRGEEWSE